MKIAKMLAALTALTLLNGCPSKKKDDNTALLLLGTLAVGAQNARSQTSAVRTLSAGVRSAVQTASSGGQITGLLPGLADPYRMLARMHEERLRRAFGARPAALPTALTSTGTCNASGCSGTLNGSTACPRGGTLTLSNVIVSFTFNGTNSNGSMNGKVTLDKCLTNATLDYMDYPAQVVANGSGSMTFDGTNSIAFTTFTISGTTLILDFLYKENSTINSDGMTINDRPTGPISGLKSVIDLRVNSRITNYVVTQTTDTYTVKADAQDSLTGSVNITGTVGGLPVAEVKDYSSTQFNYSYECTITGLGGSNIESNCTVTRK